MKNYKEKTAEILKIWQPSLNEYLAILRNRYSKMLHREYVSIINYVAGSIEPSDVNSFIDDYLARVGVEYIKDVFIESPKETALELSEAAITAQVIGNCPTCPQSQKPEYPTLTQSQLDEIALRAKKASEDYGKIIVKLPDMSDDFNQKVIEVMIDDNVQMLYDLLVSGNYILNKSATEYTIDELLNQYSEQLVLAKDLVKKAESLPKTEMQILLESNPKVEEKPINTPEKPVKPTKSIKEVKGAKKVKNSKVQTRGQKKA